MAASSTNVSSLAVNAPCMCPLAFTKNGNAPKSKPVSVRFAAGVHDSSISSMLTCVASR